MVFKEAMKTTLFILFGMLVAECAVSTNEYMKREHSLVRPFQGESARTHKQEVDKVILT